MKIIISGGSGRVGRFITRAAVAAGHEVTLLGRTPVPWLHFQRAALGQSVDFTGHEAFIHCAFSHVPGRYRGGEGDDPETFVQRNEGDTLRWFHEAKEAGVRRTVFLSSRAVYGDYPPGTVLREDMTPRPDTLYGESKWVVEKVLHEMSGTGFTPVSLRATGVYGPGAGHKWDDLFSDYLEGRAITPRVATEVHGDDLAQAVLLALTMPGGIYNVSDLTLDRHDLLALIQERTGCTHPLPARADASQVNVMDCAKLRAQGWQPGGWPRLVQAINEEMVRP